MDRQQTIGWVSRWDSLPEKVFDLLRQGIVEIVRNREFALRGSEQTLPRFFNCWSDRYQLGDRFTFIRNDNLVANGKTVEHFGKTQLRLFNGDLHVTIVPKQ